MSKNNRLREILEPKAPRLRPEAADHLELQVEEALRRRDNRRPWRWALPVLPAAAALLLLLWFKPWSGGKAPEFHLLDEAGYLQALIEFRESGGNLDDVFEDDDEETTDYTSENWTDDDWQSFQEALEDFQLTENGGA